MYRPDWKVGFNSSGIDLSQNVHYDSFLVNLIHNELTLIDTFHEYPNQFNLYSAISKYYNINLHNLTIGYGATEVLERIFKAINIKHLYIVSPTFEMVEVYCNVYKVAYTKISYTELTQLPNYSTSAVYIANPSGNTGESHNLEWIIDNFNLCIVDEAYADFCKINSLLSKKIDHLIVIKTLSKSLGIAGFRVGFCKANSTITTKLQSVRSNYIMNTFASKLVPILLPYTDKIVQRMQNSKQYFENNYDTKSSSANYVLFKQANKFTDKYGYRLVEDYYRMALLDMDTLTNDFN
jgi:histidinol-phosphate aminotransferase